MASVESQILNLSIVATIQKARQHIKQIKEKIIKFKQFENPEQIKKIQILKQEINKLSYSTIDQLEVVQKTSQIESQQFDFHQIRESQLKDSIIQADQMELRILQNIVSNKFNQNMSENNLKLKSQIKQQTTNQQFLKFLEQQPQKLIEQRLAHSKKKHYQEFSDKKFANINKYLSHKKILYQKLSGLKSGTNLFTSHQRVLLKQYLDWFRKWNNELTEKVQKKSNIHLQFIQAKKVYLNSCKKLATLVLQQKKQQENNQESKQKR